MRVSPLKQRDYIPYKQRKRTRLILCGSVAVVIALLFIVVLPALRKNAERNKSADEVLVDQYSTSKILSFWNQKNYPDILRYTSAYLKVRPLDTFALSFNGFASFYNGLNQSKTEDMLPFIDASVVSLRKALLLGGNPLKSDLYYILGKAYYHKGRFYMNSAVQNLEEALKSGCNQSDLFEYLGLAYSHMGKYDKSVDMFKKALAKNPSDILLLTLAQSYINLNDFGDAEGSLRQVIQTTRDVTVEEKSRFLLGDIYLKQKEYQKAVEQYTSVVAKNADSADAYYNLGLVYQEMGDPVRARSEWRKAIRIDPMHTGARQHLNS